MWADSNVLGDTAVGVKRVLKKIAVRFLVRKLTGVLVCGRLGIQYYKRYGVQEDRIFTVPNEPDYSLIEDPSRSLVLELMQQFRLQPNRRRLLFAGRLVHSKRVDLLIDAFGQIADDRPNWDLVIAGSGPLEPVLRARVHANLQDRVIWVGNERSPGRMFALFTLAEVLVVPSDREPWGLVVNEAACAGLAMVCSDVVGAANELLRDGENGRFFRVGQLAPLTAALRDVTDDNNIKRYRQASAQILSDWRRTADPIRGLERALEYCLDQRQSVSR